MTFKWKTTGIAHVVGHDIPHDGGVMDFETVIARTVDSEILIPRLFAEVDPRLSMALRAGGFLVAGRNFLCGKAHNNGLIALKSLGIRILCESMPLRSFQGVAGIALPCLSVCPGLSEFIANSDQLEVDMIAGTVTNLTNGIVRQYAPLPVAVRRLVEQGGTWGLLQRHLALHPHLRMARSVLDIETSLAGAQA